MGVPEGYLLGRDIKEEEKACGDEDIRGHCQSVEGYCESLRTVDPLKQDQKA